MTASGLGMRDQKFGNRDPGFGMRTPNPEPRTPNCVSAISMVSAISLLFVLALVSSAWGQAFTMRDMVGRELRLSHPPQRIISLVPSVTEIIFALGGEETLVGVTDFCDFPPAAKQKPKVGSMLDPSLEIIVASRPDVVVATDSGNRKETMAEIERLGIPVFIINPNNLGELMTAIAKLGELTGRKEAATPLIAGLTHRVDRVVQAVRPSPRPKVLYVLWSEPLIVPGRDSHLSELIELAGGANVTASDPHSYPRYSLEALITRAPEVIVLAQHGTGKTPRSKARWEVLDIPAIRNGRVHAVDGNIFHRIGPRMVDGLELLARLFHPEAFR
ncbi:MAG TPA: cobalamin-binding protein [Methylomirabilota bacterium]|nr:cobalamin-binding protein [Methylomirabilota bacterium]